MQEHTSSAMDGVLIFNAGFALSVIYCLTLGLLILHVAPESRRKMIGTGLLLCLAVLALAITAVLSRIEMAHASAIFYQAAVLLTGFAVIRASAVLLFRVISPRFGIAPTHIAEEILTLVAYVMFGLLRLRYAGLELSGIVTTSAVITGIVAFSMQDTLGNVLGGFALQLDRSLRVGDWISVEGVTGRVVDIRWRSTSLETRNWETVIVPNSTLMRSKFLVLGRRQNEPEQWRRWVWFFVGYESAPGDVIRAVEHSVRTAEIDNVARVPAPNCVLMDLEHLAGKYALRYWLTDLAVDDPTDSEVRRHIIAALERNGITPFVPESYRSAEQPTAAEHQAVDAQELEKRLRCLRHIDLFSPLTDDEFEHLAHALRHAPFVAGDRMTEQGAVAHWLYIVTDGRAEVVLEDETHQQHLGWIEAQQSTNFFGEMGLITGARRTATVIARSDVECYRLDKKAFAEVLPGRPQLAEELRRIIETRRSALESASSELAALAELANEPRQQAVLARIREFFNLD